MNRTRIALLGGGQLGRMFLENALRYDVEVHVLDPDPACPCARLAHRHVVGRFDDAAAVMAFAEDCDVVGIEIEHVSVEALEQLQARGKRVIPDPAVLRTIKDKGLQKEFYRLNGIPTEAYALVNGRADLDRHATMLPAFLKARSGGYDGRGVMALHGVADLDRAFAGPCVLEKRTDIALELAVIVVRDAGGATITYDPVEMVFDPRFNLVDHLRAPARIPAAVADEVRTLATRVADAFGEPGLYAVEMFLTTAGALLVNETAPRAHNSGHHTIEACPSSQFDQLLRLYLGWPAGATHLGGRAAMINLVGEGGTGTPDVQGLEQVLQQPGTFIHLYGKHETRTGRKMGHVSVLAPTDAGLDAAMTAVREHARIVPRNAQAGTDTQATPQRSTW